MSSITYSSDDLQMFPPDSERASPAHDKARLQRKYRAKEADALAELQKVLCDISRGAITPQTRIETIANATKAIKQLYRRNNMLRELYGQPPPVPDHSVVDFNNYLAQVQQSWTGSPSFHSNVQVADERHLSSGMIQVVHSSGVPNPSVPSDMPMVPVFHF